MCLWRKKPCRPATVPVTWCYNAALAADYAIGEDETMEEKNTLHILWTTGDVDTSLHMVLMYATRCMAYHLWDKVVVILWGASDKLAAENQQVQEAMQVAMHEGVTFTACVACARQLGLVEPLEALGVDLIGWGPPLTKILKNNEALITV